MIKFAQLNKTLQGNIPGNENSNENKHSDIGSLYDTDGGLLTKTKRKLS